MCVWFGWLIGLFVLFLILVFIWGCGQELIPSIIVCVLDIELSSGHLAWQHLPYSKPDILKLNLKFKSRSHHFDGHSVFLFKLPSSLLCLYLSSNCMRPLDPLELGYRIQDPCFLIIFPLEHCRAVVGSVIANSCYSSLRVEVTSKRVC